MYDLAKPVHLPAGTTIHYAETYANSAANPLVVHYDTPNSEVERGELTIDETIGGFVMNTVDSTPSIRKVPVLGSIVERGRPTAIAADTSQHP